MAISKQAVIGTVVSAPSSGALYRWDTQQEYVIDILSGELESKTIEGVLNGQNMAAVGADGRWHLFQFANAELIDDNRYRLTRLLLGRRGTERFIETVEVGDTFVLLTGGGMYRVPLQTSEIGAERLYRAVTNGEHIDAVDDEAFTGEGVALLPFSPYRVRGSRDESGNLTISWLRRDRLSPTLRDGVETPMSEDSESYKIEIMNGDTVVRTLTSSTTSVEYSAANQATDFGSAQDQVTVRVRQVSGTVGDGTPVEATV